MPVPVSQSQGTQVILKENRGATLWRRVTNSDVVPPDVWDVEPFMTLDPQGPQPQLVVCTKTDNYFEFSIDTTGMRPRTAYSLGWVDTAGNVEVIAYGEILVV